MKETITKEIQKNMSPIEALERLMEGNHRFVNNKARASGLIGQVNSTAQNQFPFAAILGCIDSRAPAEHIFDQGIGAIFNARIAGNIVNRDILGSLEFACMVAGAKLVLVMGHTNCGAVTAACKNVELGNLSHLLAKIRPAVDFFKGSLPDPDSVAEKNVQYTVQRIRKKSDILRAMEEDGEISIRGAMYDVATGEIGLLDE